MKTYTTTTLSNADHGKAILINSFKRIQLEGKRIINWNDAKDDIIQTANLVYYALEKKGETAKSGEISGAYRMKNGNLISEGQVNIREFLSECLYQLRKCVGIYRVSNKVSYIEPEQDESQEELQYSIKEEKDEKVKKEKNYIPSVLTDEQIYKIRKDQHIAKAKQCNALLESAKTEKKRVEKELSLYGIAI